MPGALRGVRRVSSGSFARRVFARVVGRVCSVGRVPSFGAASRRGSSAPLVVFGRLRRGIRCRGVVVPGASGSTGVRGSNCVSPARRGSFPGFHVFWT